ncbi:MAG: signal peptidase II [Actinobacteria bacterium]|nr:signal peptidase II [Actinomycetota bacterium]
MNTASRCGAAAVLVAAAFAVDQLTKAWALYYLGSDREIELGLGATLRLVFNPGIAFGLGGDLGPPLVIGIMALTLGLLVWIALRAARSRDMLATAFLAVAAGGAVGNLWDRVTRAEGGPLTGEVVDFIAIDWFAIFNVADVFTTLGIAGWAALVVLRRDPNARRDSSAGRDRHQSSTAV